MKVNRKKAELAMARACMGINELASAAGMPESTVKNTLCGRSVKPRTAGLIAAALGVDVTEIIEQEV